MSIRVVTAHETDRVRARDPEFFAAACAIVDKHDPVGHAHAIYADDFEPEVTTILLRFGGVRTEAEAVAVVRDELTAWFAPGGVIAERIPPLGRELWNRWLESTNRP
jgi:hypothetical protein